MPDRVQLWSRIDPVSCGNDVGGRWNIAYSVGERDSSALTVECFADRGNRWCQQRRPQGGAALGNAGVENDRSDVEHAKYVGERRIEHRTSGSDHRPNIGEPGRAGRGRNAGEAGMDVKSTRTRYRGEIRR